MDKRIRGIFDYGDEIVIVAEQGDLFDPARIKELTMKKINTDGLPAKSGKAMKKAGPAVRAVLIAAIVAALLVGSALAMYQLSIRDVQLSEPYEKAFLTGEAAMLPAWEEVDMSINGPADSPEARAALAWSEWNEAWREENADLLAAHEDDVAWRETPEHYAYYSADFREQAEKLDEIAAEYGLELHTLCANYGTEEELCEVLGIGDIWRDDFLMSDGRVYEDGSFAFDGYRDGEKYTMMWLAVDGTVHTFAHTLPAEYEEWSYVTADGVQVALAIAEFDYSASHMYETVKNAWLVARLEEATLSVGFAGVESRAELEACAEQINFAELSALYAEDADRSHIASAAEEQQAAYRTMIGAGIAEIMQEEALEQAALEAYRSRYTEEEWDEIICGELGDYALPETLEGHHLERRSLTYGPTAHGVTYVYYADEIQEDGKYGGEAYSFSYCRYWSDDTQEESTTRAWVDYESGEVLNIGGYDVCISGGDMGCGYLLTWYDAERELVFRISDMHKLNEPGIFTREQMLGLAEGFMESLNGN